MNKFTDFKWLQEVARGGIRYTLVCAPFLATGACQRSEPPRSVDTPSSNPLPSPQAAACAGPTHDHGAHGHSGFHRRFDDAATWSKVFDDPARDGWQQPARVVAAMELTPGMVVADVGAGTGYFLPYLARAVGSSGKVLGQDVEPSMVKWIDERATREGLANVQGLLGAPDNPKLPAAALDRVLVVDVWHHIDDRPAFAKKLAAALKPGGAVFIVDFTRESPQGPPPLARLAPDDIRADLSAAGLTTSLVDAHLPYQYVVRGQR